MKLSKRTKKGLVFVLGVTLITFGIYWVYKAFKG